MVKHTHVVDPKRLTHIQSHRELIVVIHGEYIPPGTNPVNLIEGCFVCFHTTPSRVGVVSLPIPQRSDLRYLHPLDEVTRQPRGHSHRSQNTPPCTPRTCGSTTWTSSLHNCCFQAKLQEGLLSKRSVWCVFKLVPWDLVHRSWIRVLNHTHTSIQCTNNYMTLRCEPWYQDTRAPQIWDLVPGYFLILFFNFFGGSSFFFKKN